MITLHPLPKSIHHCPYCQVLLDVRGWYIPGMRNLADLQCPSCQRTFYGDLLAGQAFYTPLLLDQSSGEVFDTYKVDWFATWLRDSYACRSTQPLGFTSETFRPVERPLLLNCLDALYGHALLKLLNAQWYIDRCPDLDLIVMVPRLLRWMVPDGVAEIWTVDLPLRRGTEWNDWLAAHLQQRLATYAEVLLSVAFSHPHPKDYTIERFTRVRPFPLDEWQARLDRPTVTFIWREDRLWLPNPQFPPLLQKVWCRLKRRLRLSHPLRKQTRQIVAVAEELRANLPTLDFAVVGLGTPGDLPSWIRDLRTKQLNPQLERSWCERYAQSHVVIGVHGSNLLLPSGHAGATIDLMPNDRWGNVLQDLLFRTSDVRETMFRCRLLPLSTSYADVVNIVCSLLLNHQHMIQTMRVEFCNHEAFRKTIMPCQLSKEET